MAARGPLPATHCGLERVDDLLTDLDRGFARLRAAAQLPARGKFSILSSTLFNRRVILVTAR